MNTYAQNADHSVEVDTINYLNIVLMVASVVVAAYLPFETFLLAYAVLGPLHYLTEISWLHDRGYFTTRSSDWIWLFGATGVMTLGYLVPSHALVSLSVFLLVCTFVVASGMAFAKTTVSRALFFLGGLIAGGVTLIGEPYVAFFIVLLPTLIHVYVFTGFFILYGAVQGRSLSAILSLLVFIAAPFVCVYGLNTPSSYQPSEYFLAAVTPFNILRDMVIALFGLQMDREGVVAWMRLMGFAYTYHYLNWFSKTRIINWHKVSRARVGVLTVLYLGAVSIYAVNYQLGYTVLVSLSLAHVVLEFPLNFKTIGCLLRDGMNTVVRRS